MFVNVLPFNANNPDVYYLSANEEIAKIDDNGLVTAQSFGETDVYAISKENETITAKCHVEI